MAHTSGSLGKLGSQLELGLDSCFHHWQLTTEVFTQTGEYVGLFCTEKRQHFG
jgi:hypothetical protein